MKCCAGKSLEQKRALLREKKRKEVAENLNQIEAVYFTVDKRAVRDRYNLLARELKTKSKKEGKKNR